MLWSLASESRAPSSETPREWFSFPNFSRLSAVRELELGSCGADRVVREHPGKAQVKRCWLFSVLRAQSSHCTSVTSLILCANPTPATALAWF